MDFMVKRTGPSNEHLMALIKELKKQKTSFWSRMARELEKPSRIRRAVNLSRINRNTKKGETVIVPGKVLGSGELNHALKIIAYTASEQAKKKIKESKSELISINEFLNSKKPTKKVRIIG